MYIRGRANECPWRILGISGLDLMDILERSNGYQGQI